MEGPTTTFEGMFEDYISWFFPLLRTVFWILGKVSKNLFMGIFSYSGCNFFNLILESIAHISFVNRMFDRNFNGKTH